MKYYRKQPVEAIQWNGDNQKEVSEFVERVSSVFYTNGYGKGGLKIGYLDSKQNNHIANIPKFGWVVIEGKTLQFYKDETFKRTFKAAEEDNKGIDWAGMTNTINSFDDVFNGFYGAYKEKLMADVDEQVNKVQEAVKEAAEMYKGPLFVPTNEDVCNDNDKKCHEDMEKKYKECSAKHPESYTFDSVIDEMKELHAKKNKDYKGIFHDLFKEYGMPYALGHLEEKLNRVKAITANGGSAVKNEHIEDSVIDLANYALMLYVELKNKENGKL